MREIMRLITVVTMVVALAVLASTASAVKDHKPRLRKNYIPRDKLGTVSTEDLAERDAGVVEKASFFDSVKNDARLKKWIAWWRSCSKAFTMDAFVDAGVSSLAGSWQPYDKAEIAGPNTEFLVKRRDIKILPVWGRMRYVRRGKQWQAQMRNAFCGVMLYKGDKARKVIECGELDGVSQAFWKDNKRFVVTSYRKMTPEMSVECKEAEVGKCVAPIIWLVDLDDDSVWEYRGPVVTFDRCEPNDFLMQRYPTFFVQKEQHAK